MKKEQYAGEPVFMCNDPEIPIHENARDPQYGQDKACYQTCHFDANHTLTMKSLHLKSKTGK